MMSLYIPRVFININEARIMNVFDSLLIGKVHHVDLVYKKSTTPGKPDYYSAYVFFKEWYNTPAARNLIDKIKYPGKEAKIVYDDPWYWIVLQNNLSHPYYPSEDGEIIDKPTKKQLPLEEKKLLLNKLARKLRICLNPDTQHKFELSLKLPSNPTPTPTHLPTTPPTTPPTTKPTTNEPIMTDEDYKRCEDYFDMLDQMDECENFMDHFESSTTVYYNLVSV